MINNQIKTKQLQVAYTNLTLPRTNILLQTQMTMRVYIKEIIKNNTFAITYENYRMKKIKVKIFMFMMISIIF